MISNRFFKKGFVLFPFSTACCQLECLSLTHGPHNVRRHNIEVTDRPNQANTLLILGRVEKGQIDLLKKTYAQLLPPKHVIAAGVCALSGGIFCDQEDVVNDLGAHIPVTCWIPGCPAKPDEVLRSFLALTKGMAP